MNKAPLVVVSTLLLMLTACDSEQTTDVSENNDEMAAETGFDFDLIETSVGDVNFPTQCNTEAAPLVERGVALMHHMMYDEARLVFSMANDQDSECAIAYWGEAMTYVNPLWPGEAGAKQMARGLELVERAKELGGHDDRENLYLKTGEAYFIGGAAITERERLKKMEIAFQQLSMQYPDDLEAQAFHALFLIATADIGDPELVQQRQAGEMAKDVLSKNADHPGAHHYVIHAYDNPDLAPLALPTADRYGTLTPRVPHATHMMTHTYTRLGLWDKAIDWNTVSAETALEICISTGEVNLHYTHALDYLAYAYLQKGEDDDVRRVLADADALKAPYSELNLDASAYALSALPARYALERRDWEAAAALEPRMPVDFPWADRFDQYVAVTHFARALAAINLGQPADAEADIMELNRMRGAITSYSPYWAKQVEIQEMSARAWQLYASGDQQGGLAMMQQAAELEATTEKHAVTPGEVLPAAELYGDMLLASGRYEDALGTYRVALERSPGRYNSLYGAARAAIGMGDQESAATYLAELLENAKDAPDERDTLREARKLLTEL